MNRTPNRDLALWTVTFLLPFLIVGFLCGSSYYHHLEKDIGKNYSSWGKEADYKSILTSCGAVFLVCGGVAGLTGIAILAIGKGFIKLSKKTQS